MNHAEMQFLDVEFPFKKQYANFIGGEWVKPVGGEYFDDHTLIAEGYRIQPTRSRTATIAEAIAPVVGVSQRLS